MLEYNTMQYNTKGFDKHNDIKPIFCTYNVAIVIAKFLQHYTVSRTRCNQLIITGDQSRQNPQAEWCNHGSAQGSRFRQVSSNNRRGAIEMSKYCSVLIYCRGGESFYQRCNKSTCCNVRIKKSSYSNVSIKNSQPRQRRSTEVLI